MYGCIVEYVLDHLERENTRFLRFASIRDPRCTLAKVGIPPTSLNYMYMYALPSLVYGGGHLMPIQHRVQENSKNYPPVAYIISYH